MDATVQPLLYRHRYQPKNDYPYVLLYDCTKEFRRNGIKDDDEHVDYGLRHS